MVACTEVQQSPLMLILCPPPVNVVVTSNTFVEFNHCNNTTVGLVLTVNPLEQSVSIQLFLTWNDVKEQMGTLHLPKNVSFWPKYNRYLHYYLCDTDLTLSNVSVAEILRLCFVFHDSSPILHEITGMRHTYRVTSCVWFTQNLIIYGNTIKPFPSERFPSILMSCFPSIICSQLLCLKQQLQRLLNTRSLSSKNSAVTKIHNVDLYTRLYLLRDSPVMPQLGSVVSRAGSISFDEYIQRSRREPQLSFWVGSANHLSSYVQGLFGLSFGIGVQFMVSCRLPRSQTSIEASQKNSPSATLNVVPFEEDYQELVRRGVYLNYRPTSKLLTITV
jgi:hypothetical protein